jgi:hypothetical protein
MAAHTSLHDALSGIPELSATSVAVHVTRLRALQRLACASLKRPAGEGLECDVLLKHGALTCKLVETHYKPGSSAASVYNSLLALYRCDPALRRRYARSLRAFKIACNKHRGIERKKYHAAAATDGQCDNWVHFDSIKAKLLELQEDPRVSLDPKLNRAALLLAVQVHLKPKRNDFGAVRVYARGAPASADSDRQNYVDLQKGSLVLHRYQKTGKREGAPIIREHLPAPLVAAIRGSLKLQPRRYLFEDRAGRPYVPDSYGAFVRRVYKRLFGVRCGTTLLRHIYVTERVDLNSTMAQKEKVAKLMGHSVEQQALYKLPEMARP